MEMCVRMYAQKSYVVNVRTVGWLATSPELKEQVSQSVGRSVG